MDTKESFLFLLIIVSIIAVVLLVLIVDNDSSMEKAINELNLIVKELDKLDKWAKKVERFLNEEEDKKKCN